MSEYPWDIESMMLAQHDQPCDCAICDEIHRTREIRKSRGAKCFLNNDGTSDCDRLRVVNERYENVINLARKITKTPDGNTLDETLNYTMALLSRYEQALRKVARGTLEPGHVYQQAVMMQDIAREALADRP